MLRLPESKLSAGDNVSIFKHTHSFEDATPLERGVIVKKNDFKYVVALASRDDDSFNESALSHEVLSLLMEANHVTFNRYLKCLENLNKAHQDINKFPGSSLLRVLLEGADPTNLNPHLKPAHHLKKPITNFHKKDLNIEQ